MNALGQTIKGFRVLLLWGLFSVAAAGSGYAARAKYVFLFIGDGMGAVQVAATESYRAAIQLGDEVPGSTKMVKLNMSGLPALGMITTFAHNRLITGSAAAGTALACGKKTAVGVVSMDPSGKVPYRTLAEAAKSRGMKVGIISSVSIDHATPAVFYTQQPDRKNYYEIAMALSASGFDFFAGGGFLHPTGKSGDRPSAIDTARKRGYRVATGREEIGALSAGAPVLARNRSWMKKKALFYALDKPSDHLSLGEFTKKGIELLDNPDGFFMVVESGKIDWASQARDAATVMSEVAAFDDAVGEALTFYREHPEETLIVVTGDHESGGMTLGAAGGVFETHLELLQKQSMSYARFSGMLAERLKKGISFTEAMDSAREVFGLALLGEAERMRLVEAAKNGDREAADRLLLSLEPFEIRKITEAWNMSLLPGNRRPGSREVFLKYGKYDPFTVTLARVLSAKVGIGWTTFNHTAVPVPVYAGGAGSDSFNGYYDNTDLALKIAGVMGVSLN